MRPMEEYSPMVRGPHQHPLPGWHRAALEAVAGSLACDQPPDPCEPRPHGPLKLRPNVP